MMYLLCLGAVAVGVPALLIGLAAKEIWQSNFRRSH